MKSESKCEKCGQPLEEWESGVCEGRGISGGLVQVQSGESRSENGSFTFAYWVAGFLMSSTFESRNMTAGGKRINAGRKPQADGQGRSIPKSIKVSQAVADYLAANGTGLIEDFIRRSKAFREWQKTT